MRSANAQSPQVLVLHIGCISIVQPAGLIASNGLDDRDLGSQDIDLFARSSLPYDLEGLYLVNSIQESTTNCTRTNYIHAHAYKVQ